MHLSKYLFLENAMLLEQYENYVESWNNSVSKHLKLETSCILGRPPVTIFTDSTVEKGKKP